MGTQHHQADLVETVGPFWSAEAVTRETGMPPGPGSVLAVVTSDGVPLYPVSQFVEHDGRDCCTDR